MKKIIGIGIVAMMVMGMAGAANAAFLTDTDWVLSIKTSTSADFSAYASTSTVKTLAGKSNYYVSTEDTLAPPTGAASLTYAYSVNTQADATTKNLLVDTRNSLTEANPIVSWVIKLGLYKFGGDGEPVAPEGMYVRIWNPKNTAVATKNVFAPLNSFEKISVFQSTNGVKGSWITDIAGGTGTTADGPAWTSALLPLNSELIIEASAVPLATVPEPGSMVAMMSGLVGLAGFAIRRRK